MSVVFVFCQADLSPSNLKKIFKQKEILTKELDTFKRVKQALEHLLRKPEYQQVRNINHQFNSGISHLKAILFFKL